MARRNFGSVLELPPRRGWYARFTWRGRRLWRAAGPTAAIARGKLARLQLLLEGGNELEVALHEVFGDRLAKGMTFRAAVPEYQEYSSSRKKPSTLLSDKYRFRILMAGSWAARPLAEITPEALSRWCEERLKDGACGITINHDLNLGSALFKWAVRMGYATANPFRRVERFPTKGREREVYLTPDEARALVSVASPIMKPILLLALSTGMRRGEILALNWSCVDLDRREILVASHLAKSGRKRVVPMTDDLHRELLALRAGMKVRSLLGTDPVFARMNGRWRGRPVSVGVVRHGLETAVKLCTGIEAEKKAKLTFHTLRHTAASLMAMAGVPIFDIAKVLGHSSVGVTMRYAHFAPESGRAAIERLGEKLAFGTA